MGQTGRSLDQRIKEHLDVFNNKDPHKSSLPKHLKDTSHDPLKINTVLLHQVPEGTVLNRLEEFKVVKVSHRSPLDLLLDNMKFTYIDAFPSLLFENK